MSGQEHDETRNTVSKLILYGTVVSGLVAAYLMHRRGESVITIARKTVTNPIGSLVAEVKNVT